MSRAEFYRLVSGVIRAQMLAVPPPDARTRAAYEALARSLCHAFAQRNMKFDPARFLADAAVTSPQHTAAPTPQAAASTATQSRFAK